MPYQTSAPPTPTSEPIITGLPQVAEHPQLPQTHADQWARKQNLEKYYNLHKGRSRKTIDIVAKRAVRNMGLTRFTNVRPTHSSSDTDTTRRDGPLFHAGSPPEDLSFSMREFSAADDPNPVFAKIVAGKGRANRTRGLAKVYNRHKGKAARSIDPVAEQAVKNMALSRFQFAPPTTDQPQPEDLGYSLRNFLTVNMLDDPNMLSARIAVKEGHVLPGYIPSLPESRRVLEGEEAELSSERETRGGW